MDASKQAQMDALLTTLHRQWGVHVLQHGTTLPAARPPVPTGFPPLDTLLGGVPRGAVTVLLGAPTSGATTLALHIVCQAQASRDCALYIDLDSTFDPAYAARCGVALDRLFLARPDTALQALDLARDLLVSGSVAALVLDVGRARPQPHLLRRLSAGLTRWGGLVLLLAWLENDIPAPDWPAALRLQVERMRWLVSGDDVVGYCARVTVLKGREGAQVEVEFRVDGGLPR